MREKSMEIWTCNQRRSCNYSYDYSVSLYRDVGPFPCMAPLEGVLTAEITVNRIQLGLLLLIKVSSMVEESLPQSALYNVPRLSTYIRYSH